MPKYMFENICNEDKKLSYLYGCLKKCVSVDIENLREVIKVDIGNSYWNYIILELYRDGYIDGITVFKHVGSIAEGVKINNNFKIKPKGIDFLESNSAIARAKVFLKGDKEILSWL